ncbi:MAG: S49 family peptidase, partial [Amphiplicatus sp.]
MSGDEHNFTVWGFIKGFGKLLIGLLLLLQGLIGLAVLILFVGVLVSVSNGMAGGKPAASASIEKGSALLFNPNGVLVEQAEYHDPFGQVIEQAYGVNSPGQIEVGSVLRALRKAKDDARVAALVLDLSQLAVDGSSASKLHDIADEIDAFRAGGKKVIAIGDSYEQEQYFLASHADEIYMNDFGQVLLYGYGSYGVYMKSLLDKLKVTSHVFRVGTFKSAIEPFIRDDMSPAAKE